MLEAMLEEGQINGSSKFKGKRMQECCECWQGWKKRIKPRNELEELGTVVREARRLKEREC